MIESVVVDPRIKVRKAVDLLLIPKTVVVQSFDENGAQAFRHDMSLAHRTGQSIIPILIDSYGGDTYALLSMIDTIKSSKIQVATIIQGKAMSCGAVLFTCGAEGYRFMSPNATLMIHDVAHYGPGGKVEDIKVDAKETERLNKKLYRIMDANCGKTAGYFESFVKKKGRADWYLGPVEAMKLGIVNHVQIPTFKTSVTVETVLEY